MGQRRGRSLNLLSALGTLSRRVLAAVASRWAPRDEVLNRWQTGAAATRGLSRRDFEKLISTGFQQRGFQVSQRAVSTPAGDIEWVLTRGYERFLVRCKPGLVGTLTRRAIRELHASMSAQRMAGGFVVTSRTFSKEARQLAAAKNIELIDGAHLEVLLRDGRRRVADVVFSGVAANGPETAPLCPACETPMIVRTAKRGAGAGSYFWGCSHYPACPQTMVMWSVARRSA